MSPSPKTRLAASVAILTCLVAPAFADDDWNRYRIVVQGNRYRSWINGVAASDFTDDVHSNGFIGLQVHGIGKDQGPYQVRWRSVRIRELKPGEPVAARAGER